MTRPELPDVQVFLKYYLPDIDKAVKTLEELLKKYNKEVNELFKS